MRNGNARFCPAMKAQTRNTDDPERCLLAPGHAGGHSFDKDIQLFLNEFTEVWQDTASDLRIPMLHQDVEVAQRIGHFILELFRLGDDNADAVLNNLTAGMLTMFLAGREHATRGYSSPVAKLDHDGHSWVPDTPAELFGDTT